MRMPRLARVVVPGVPHHACQRGNSRMPTFLCDEAYVTIAISYDVPRSTPSERHPIDHVLHQPVDLFRERQHGRPRSSRPRLIAAIQSGRSPCRAPRLAFRGSGANWGVALFRMVSPE